MKITQFGQSYEVNVFRSKYSYFNNLAIVLMCEDGEPYGRLTVNLGNKLPEDMAYVDTNNMPSAETFIEENNLGFFVGRYGDSGYCSYPLYKFNLDRIEKINCYD